MSVASVPSQAASLSSASTLARTEQKAREAQKKHILTSMLKRIDTAVFEYAEAFDGGSAPSGFVTYDLKSGGVDYSTSGGFVDDITDQIDEYKDQIIAGEVKVPTAP